MKPNTFVTILLRTTPPIEIKGTVKSWKKAEIVLINEKQTTEITLPRPDILMISTAILKKEDVPHPKQLPLPNEDLLPGMLEEQFEELKTSSADDRTKKLVDLKILMNKQERKIIEERVRNHIPSINNKNHPYKYSNQDLNSIPSEFLKDS